jgi:hypothetical protein
MVPVLQAAVSNVPQVLRIRCHYCSQFRSPHEITDIGQGGARMCWHCYEWHLRALDLLCNGNPPPGCQECGTAFADLERRAAEGNFRMYAHPKDGFYQILCQHCSDEYERKRADLYGATVYGHTKQIDGSK